MTKKHDAKVAAEAQKAAIAQHKDDEKRLRSAEKKIVKKVRTQTKEHASKPRF